MKTHRLKLILTGGAVALLGWLALAYGTEIDPSSYSETGGLHKFVGTEVAQ